MRVGSSSKASLASGSVKHLNESAKQKFLNLVFDVAAECGEYVPDIEVWLSL